MQKILPVLLLAFIATFTQAQKVNNKNAKFKTALKPLVPVKGVSQIGLKVYQTGDAPFGEHSFKVSKIENAQGNPEVKRYALNDYELVDNGGDLMVELAFDKITATSDKKLYTYKAPCVLDDGHVDKEDIMECDAYAYEQSFNVPLIMRIVTKAGDVVYVEDFSQEKHVKFGESDANPFLKKADLETFYANNANVIQNLAYQEQLENCLDHLDEVLFFTKYTDDFMIGAGKGDHDYSKQEQAQDIALKVFGEDRQSDFSGLNEAISIWEEELKGKDLADKKAKISIPVAAALHGNLAVSYMYQKDFDKALSNVLEFKKLAKMSTNMNVYDRADALQDRILYFKRSEEMNGDVTLGEDRKSEKEFKITVSENRKGKNFLASDNKFATFKSDLEKFEKAQATEAAEENAMISESAPKSNPYRNQIVSSASQGNMLVMNAWTHAKLMGQPMPAEVADLVELNQLMANNLQLTSLPENIGNLKGLTSLKLKGNNLTSIPESIGQLTELKTLDLSMNQLTTLPESIKGCVNLKKVTLKGNNISADEMKKIKANLPKKCKVK